MNRLTPYAFAVLLGSLLLGSCNACSDAQDARRDTHVLVAHEGGRNPLWVIDDISFNYEVNELAIPQLANLSLSDLQVVRDRDNSFAYGVYVASASDKRVHILFLEPQEGLTSASLFRYVGFIQLTNTPSALAVGRTGDNLYVATKEGTVAWLDTTTRTQVAEVTLAQGADPTDIEVDDQEKNLFVVGRGLDRLFFLDVAQRRISNSIAVGHQPFRIARVADRYWVTNWGNNTVSIIDPALQSVAATISNVVDAFGIDWSPGGQPTIAAWNDTAPSTIWLGSQDSTVLTPQVAQAPIDTRAVAVTQIDQYWLGAFASRSGGFVKLVLPSELGTGPPYPLDKTVGTRPIAVQWFFTR